ncbi:MAG: 5-formyltetrahydrofolate cyclo-ligase [Breznakibacter sp.]
MDIVQQKKALRQLIRDRKKEYSAAYLANLSIPIQGVIETMEVFHTSEIILAYWAMPDEVQTKLLINKWNGCKKFYLPVVVGDDLEFRLYEGAESLEARGKFNILEPTGPLLPNDARVDMILVPGVAFTEKGARLGRGKGYYDRILSRFPEAYKLGMAFGFQVVDEIPMESHDCLMSGVVSGQ